MLEEALKLEVRAAATRPEPLALAATDALSPQLVPLAKQLLRPLPHLPLPLLLPVPVLELVVMARLVLSHLIAVTAQKM